MKATDFFLDFDAPEYVKGIETDIHTATKHAFLKLANRLPKQVMRVFEGSRTQQGTRDGSRQSWEPTSRIALTMRKTYPQTGAKKTGKKGYTQAQARFLFSAPTLVDTGALRDSIQTLEMSLDTNPEIMFIGSPLPYAPLMGLGGKATLPDGKQIDVPARDFLFFTEMDFLQINSTFEGEMAYDG